MPMVNATDVVPQSVPTLIQFPGCSQYAGRASFCNKVPSMFRSQTANLPPEQRQRVHADFLADEQAYLHMRDQLLAQYAGQWVAVHRGRVIAAGDNLLTVMSVAAATGGRPYIARVGAEDNIVFRIRW